MANRSLTCLLISDTHGEFDSDGGIQMAHDLPNEGVDVLVAAGDITTLEHVHGLAHVLVDRFPRVLWVCGNHEFYGATRSAVQEEFSELNQWSNFTWLNQGTVTINQVVFSGTTAWWGPDERNPTQAEVALVRAGDAGRVVDQIARLSWSGLGDKTQNLGRYKARARR